ncbi:MAG: dephospho-CoA kinase [Proteobacteria bacterium]|nr:dephospho-CoA kinase [Pseudomonadota bacterium]
MKNFTLIGLTGNMGTGKSTVSWMFQELGVPILDADEIAHEAIAPRSHAWRQIYERYGNAVMDKGGRIDRATLARVVFQDPAERKYLETLIHPMVRAEIERRAAALGKEGRPFVIAEVPLLIEAHWEGLFDAIVVVRCLEEQEIERCVQKFGMSREEVMLRLGAQFPLERKVAAADAVIDNDGTFEETRVQVKRLYQEMVKGTFPKR